ncbi:hypothetical protein MOO44_06060 [Nicoliella spurrieriana]|uniref:Uncharacterized protein n=1 Tax=Nicoliella spurrieriana TaxID=2925830 RepID=A0A976RRK5_9LACO|nr:hypothetical protein [Nicoliella spurrieriana]UQS86455.1 hypothetical protein MOO44_06060 [Nicoliella spurrieriana]
MSNRFELLVEYRQAFRELENLKNSEAANAKLLSNGHNTITIEPEYGNKMKTLTKKCNTLKMILAAMDASED